MADFLVQDVAVSLGYVLCFALGVIGGLQR